jgi:hypothetical protein
VNDGTILAFFEVDSRIFFDKKPQVVLSAALIVNGMLLSLERGCPLELSSSIVTEEDSPKNCHIPLAERRNLEIFEIRTLESEVICELERRWIPKRQCEYCKCWIPPSGPPLCLADMFDRAAH